MHTNSPYLVRLKIFCRARWRIICYENVLTAHGRKNEIASGLRYVCRWFVLFGWTFIFIHIEWPKKPCACRMKWYSRLFVSSSLLAFFSQLCNVNRYYEIFEQNTYIFSLVSMIYLEHTAGNNQHQQLI